MYNRIRICLCHPKMIGLYFKDSVFKIISYFMILILLFIGVCASVAYCTDHFNYDDTRRLTDLIYLGNDSDIFFDANNKTISGKKVKFESNNVILNFLVEENYATSQKMIFRFKPEKVEVIFRGIIVKSISYEDIPVESFSLANIQKGNIKDKVEFQDFMNLVLNKCNINFAAFYFLDILFSNVMYFVIIFICALVFSFFTNPNIDIKIRLKLCFYSISVYFLIIILSMLFDAAWLQYLALFLPIVYTNITFSHIIKVEKRRAL